MKLLDAVNLVLPIFGEATITTVNRKHPTVALILDNMKYVQKTLLAEGWWFNTAEIDLFPSREENIATPDMALSIEGLNGANIEIRGRYIVDLDRDSFKFKNKVRAKIIYDMDFEDLPYTVANYIAYHTAVVAYTKDYGYEDLYQVIAMGEQKAYQKMLAEHLRKKKYSTLRSPYAQKYMNALRG